MTQVLEANMPDQAAIDSYYEALTPYWHPVARLADLGDSPTGVVLLGRPVVLVKLGGEVRAFENVCRHLGAELSLGEVVNGETLRCRYHGWEYDGEGKCVKIPLRDNNKIPSQARVRKYHCKVAYDLVWVCMAEEPAADIPAYPQFDDDDYWKGNLIQHPDWKASLPRLVMAALDDTHFSWVHPGILGVAEQPVMPHRLTDKPVFTENGVLVSKYKTKLPVNPITAGEEAVGADPNEVEDAKFTNFATVNTMANVIETAKGISVTFNAFSPITYLQTRTFTQIARNFDKAPEFDEPIEQTNSIIKGQDQEVAESQRPWLLPPLNARLLLYVRPEDAPLVEYQKLMERIGVPQI